MTYSQCLLTSVAYYSFVYQRRSVIGCVIDRVWDRILCSPWNLDVLEIKVEAK